MLHERSRHVGSCHAARAALYRKTNGCALQDDARRVRAQLVVDYLERSVPRDEAKDSLADSRLARTTLVRATTAMLCMLRTWRHRFGNCIAACTKRRPRRAWRTAN